MLLLIHSVEFSVNRIDRKGCWSWHVSKINIIFLQLYLLHFLFNMSTDSFFTWSRRFVPKKLEFRLLHRTWSPGWPVVAKNPLVLTYLDIPNRPSWKHFWIRLSRSELTVDFFEIVLDETNFDCALQIRMLISWTCKNLQQMLLVCRFSNWLISNAISLNSFDKISMEMFLIKCGCYVKMFICVFDQFSSRHFERKYGSATAHLVFFAPFCWEYESRIFPSNRSDCLPEVCQSSSHKPANVGCSCVWLSNFHSSNCFKFAVDCDWSCKISQNVPNSVFFPKKSRVFLKSLKVANLR